MKVFNPDKELNKIQRGNRNKIILFVISLLVVGVIGYSFALYQVRYSKRIIYTKVAPFSNHDIDLAVVIDGSPSSDNDFPSKTSGKSYEKIVCDDNTDNHVKANWDEDRWALIVETTKKAKCTVYFKTGTVTNTPNPPELYQGLIPVTFDSNGNVKVANTNTTWYNYDAKQWANAVLVDNSKYNTYYNKPNTTIPMSDILQMYVWIPRYKYKLFNVHNVGGPEQEIKIQFENGTETTGTTICEIDTKGKETCKYDGIGNWYTHPAFTFGNTELTGLWFGKFEAGGTINDIKLLPGQTAIQNQYIKDMFNAIRNLEVTNALKYNLNQSKIDTHLIKNVEWGAMSYLAYSKYGRCKLDGTCEDITTNENYNKTGYADSNSAWTTSNGQLASTTGNMYGIYDVSGGLWEYVMGIMVDANGLIVFGGSGFNSQNVPQEKYYDKYEYGTNSMGHSCGHLGDATRETLKTFGAELGGWNGDWAIMVTNSKSWFVRAGHSGYGTNSGIFTFLNWGAAEFNGFHTTRVVLTAQDGDE